MNIIYLPQYLQSFRLMKDLRKNNSFMKYVITLNQEVRSYMQMFLFNLISFPNSLLSNNNKSPSTIPYDIKL
jgi:hypothetical protein